eukprot:5508058-Amphidinium_carterae.1
MPQGPNWEDLGPNRDITLPFAISFFVCSLVIIGSRFRVFFVVWPSLSNCSRRGKPRAMSKQTLKETVILGRTRAFIWYEL